MSVANRPERPLSPHLQVYRPQLTSVLSILHRATGIALSTEKNRETLLRFMLQKNSCKMKLKIKN